MKTIRTLTILLLIGLGAFAAEPAIELRGVMSGVGATRLSLVDKTNDTTRWVEVGQSFAGFALKAYDVATETATLTKEGKEYHLRINSSQILDAPLAPGGTNPNKILLAAARAIFNNLRQIAAAADQYYLESGKSTVTVDDLVGPTKYIKQLTPVAGEDYHTLKLSGAVWLYAVSTSSGENVTYDNTGKTSSFYAVRAGETLAQIAQKTGSSIQSLVELNEIQNSDQLRVGQLLLTK